MSVSPEGKSYAQFTYRAQHNVDQDNLLHYAADDTVHRDKSLAVGAGGREEHYS